MSGDGVIGSFFEIKDCGDYEEAKKLIREYSEIKGAESCFVSLDKELADLDTYYKDGYAHETTMYYYQWKD